MALFVTGRYLSPDEQKCWLLLSKASLVSFTWILYHHHFPQVFRLAYCIPLRKDDIDQYRETCRLFVESTVQYMPTFSKRLKVHLILHLVDCIVEFGPASCFSTERYVNNVWFKFTNPTIEIIRFEAFNLLMRTQNVYGNRHSPSRDISNNFAVLEYLRFICSGGLYQDEQAPTSRMIKCSLYQ